MPVNIVLIAIAAMVAARLGYAWLGGSEGRDDASRFMLVVLVLLACSLPHVAEAGLNAQSRSASVIIVQKASLPADEQS